MTRVGLPISTDPSKSARCHARLELHRKIGGSANFGVLGQFAVGASTWIAYAAATLPGMTSHIRRNTHIGS